jgi:hypothetical protein
MDMSKLFEPDKLYDFWPSGYATPFQNSQSTIRFIIYATFVAFVITRDMRYILIGAAAAAFVMSQYTSLFSEVYEDESPNTPTKQAQQVFDENPLISDNAFTNRFNPVPKNDLQTHLEARFPGMLVPNCREDPSKCDPDARGLGRLRP